MLDLYMYTCTYIYVVIDCNIMILYRSELVDVILHIRPIGCSDLINMHAESLSYIYRYQYREVVKIFYCLVHVILLPLHVYRSLQSLSQAVYYRLTIIDVRMR